MATSMSGIAVSDICLSAFDDVKKRKKHRYVTFSINGDEVSVKSQGDRNGNYDDFLAQLDDKEPCYIVYDFEYQREGGVSNSKLVFISWIPDNAPTRKKMIYASTKDSLKAKIEGGLVEVQATDLSEVSHKEILARVQKF